MTSDRVRRNRTKKLVTGLAVLLTTTFLAGPALADHRDYRRGDRHDRYDRHYDHGDYRHRDRHHHKRHRKHYRHARRHHRGYPVYSHHYAGYGHEARGYFCGPCNHRFGSYRALSHHVHTAHHIPLWKLPFLIVESVFHGIAAFVFHG